jgi:hypothetical protein
MAALPDQVKTHIVTSLACFDTTKDVIADVKDKFGLVVTHQQVSAYDPATTNGKRLSEKYKELFEETREKFKANVSAIPIANVTVRLRALDKMARKAADSNNAKLAAALMEQAAKEVGGAYTNKREVTGKDGQPLVPPSAPLTPEARDALIAQSLSEF